MVSKGIQLTACQKKKKVEHAHQQYSFFKSQSGNRVKTETACLKIHRAHWLAT